MQHYNLTQLANQFGSDKGTQHFCAHNYAVVYETLLGAARSQPFRLLEIGLVHARLQSPSSGKTEDIGCPSLKMWHQFFPAAQIFGFDNADYVSSSTIRMTIIQGDQSNPADLARLVDQTGGEFDVIIDDGSHASHHQQITLGYLFKHLNPGGYYCIEDLHFQPEGLELDRITKTRDFLRGLRYNAVGARVALDQESMASLLTDIESIHFFDSQSPHWRLEHREDALAVIQKRGTNPLLSSMILRGDQHSTDGTAPIPTDANYDTNRPEFFAGSAFFQGNRIYSCGYIGTPDPRNWGNAAHVTVAPTLDRVEPSPYHLGDTIDFRIKGNALPFQKYGWDFPSQGGTWTLAQTSILVLRFEDPPTEEQAWTLEILAQGLVGPTHPQTIAEITVNGDSLGEHAFGYEQLLRLTIPTTTCRMQPDGSTTIEFKVQNPVSPQTQGLSEDCRELGLLLVRLCIVSEPAC